MEELRNEYPVLQTHTYLNTPSNGLLSKPILDWRRTEDKKLLKGGSLHRDTHKEQIVSIKNTVSRFFSVANDEIALVPNFSLAMNMVLDSLPKGKKVLLLEGDYPSVTWSVKHRNFNICYANIDENLEDNIHQAVTEHQPDVFVFSIVQFISGIKIDFEFIQQLKAYHPNLLLIADGTQYLGTESFNFSESAIDILAASTYKWMLSGYGNALLFVKREAQEALSPKFVGFNSAASFDSSLEETAKLKHFEPGHIDILPFGTLEQSILKFERIGMQAISERIQTLCDYARERFIEKGLLEELVLKREHHSNIFNIKGGAVLFQKLAENNIICSQRGNGIRVGFHFYNNRKDVDRFLGCL